MEYHYYDFERDQKLLVKLRNFVGSLKTKSMQKWVVSIHRSLQKKEEEKPSSFKHVFNKQSEPVEWHIAKNKEDYHILKVHVVIVCYCFVNVTGYCYCCYCCCYMCCCCCCCYHCCCLSFYSYILLK